jgi:hypothetical protein
MFNWGYHDGIAAAYAKKSYHSIDNNKAAGIHYKAGWRAGFNHFKDVGNERNADSKFAWDEYNMKKRTNPRRKARITMSGKKMRSKSKVFKRLFADNLKRVSDPRKRKKILSKAGFRVNPARKVLRPAPQKLRMRKTRRIIERSQNVIAHGERVLSGVKGHVCVQEQRGGDWFTVMQSKDTPQFRELAKRYAKTLKRLQPKKSFRVVSY